MSSPSLAVHPVGSPRERAASRSSRRCRAAQRSRPARGSTSALPAGGDVAGARAEARDAGSVGEIPQRPEIRVGRIAVEEDDRGVRQQRADQEVPHHPAGGREPEEPLAGLRVEVQVQLLQVLEEDPALAVDDRLRQPGRAGRVEHPQRVVERQLRELELGAAPRSAAVPECRRRRRGRGGRPSLEARDLLPERGDRRRAGRSPCRRSGSRRRRAAPSARSGRSGRPRCGAELRRAARPGRADARAGEEGRDRLGDVREVGGDAVAGPDAGSAQAAGDRAGRRPQLAPRQLRQRPQLGGVTIATSVVGACRGRRAPRS